MRAVHSSALPPVLVSVITVRSPDCAAPTWSCPGPVGPPGVPGAELPDGAGELMVKAMFSPRWPPPGEVAPAEGGTPGVPLAPSSGVAPGVGEPSVTRTAVTCATGLLAPPPCTAHSATAGPATTAAATPPRTARCRTTATCSFSRPLPRAPSGGTPIRGLAGAACCGKPRRSNRGSGASSTAETARSAARGRCTSGSEPAARKVPGHGPSAAPRSAVPRQVGQSSRCRTSSLRSARPSTGPRPRPSRFSSGQASAASTASAAAVRSTS
ncbi:hypothetical protein DN069_27905, partial [Streptacidiphilus pinicola]